MLHPVVMLFDMTDGSLSLVPATTFAAEGVLERLHLERALRTHIQILGDGLLVVAEEFGDFQDARRRIDLLCVNHEARLVVVELKRTDDGGHMELQALRYAAMVSTMTLDQLAEIYQRHLDASTAGESQTREPRWRNGLRKPAAMRLESAATSASCSRRRTSRATSPPPSCG